LAQILTDVCERVHARSGFFEAFQQYGAVFSP